MKIFLRPNLQFSSRLYLIFPPTFDFDKWILLTVAPSVLDRRDEEKKVEEENNIEQDKISRETHTYTKKGWRESRLCKFHELTLPVSLPFIETQGSEFPCPLGEEENNERMKRETWAIRLKRLTEVCDIIVHKIAWALTRRKLKAVSFLIRKRIFWRRWRNELKIFSQRKICSQRLYDNPICLLEAEYFLGQD